MDWIAAGDLQSCNSITWGECEDYTFNVVPPPTCGVVTGVAVNVTGFTTANFSWNAATGGTNAPVRYLYAVTTSATPPAPGLWIDNGLSTTVTGATTTANVQNFLHVRVDCDPLLSGADYGNWVVTPFFSGYCQPTSTTNNATYFTNITSTQGLTNFNNPSTFSAAPSGYEDFSSTVSCSQYPGQNIGVSMTFLGGSAAVNVWVDWNNDLDFGDAGELIIGSNQFFPTGTIGSVFTVPSNQAPGSYRMRFRIDWNTLNTPSCGAISRGEAEDYTLNVVAIPSCSTVLGSFASTYTTTTDLPLVCTGQSINLSVGPPAPIASGITYRLQYSASIGFGTPTNVSTSSSPDFNVPTPATGFYRIQLLCSGSPITATWTPVAISISNPTITGTTPASRCGNGTLTLSATNSPASSTIAWYLTSTGGNAVATGSSFTTPVLSATTSYYVQAENVVPNATIGAGSTPNGGMVISPFSCLWESSRNWYLIRKSELQAAGLVASDLTSLKFNVTSASAVSMNNYTIKIAHTSALNMNSGYATVNSGFSTVYGPANIPPAPVGVYNFNFIPGAFAWNGVDNIIIEICHNNDPTGVLSNLSVPPSWGTSGTVTTSSYTFNTTYGMFQDDIDFCPLTTDPSPFPNTPVLINTRPTMIIGGQISACNSSRVEVIATINNVPNLTVPSNQTFAPSVGNFNPIPLIAASTTPLAGVTVTPAAGMYVDAATSSSYVSGDNINNVTTYYAPLSTTTYTATADLPNGCTTSGTFTITVDQSGIPASACAATLINASNSLTWSDVNTLGSPGGLGAPCGGIVNEIWLKTVVSASGEIHVVTRSNGTSLTDITASNIALYREVAPFGCSNINQFVCNTNGYIGDFSYASLSDLNPGENIYIRVAGLSSATVAIGRVEIAIVNYLVWTPTNGDNFSLAENWMSADAASLTIPNATRSILVPANNTVAPKLTANSTVRGVNLQAPVPYFFTPGINLNGFTLNVKGNWNVGPVAKLQPLYPATV